MSDGGIEISYDASPAVRVALNQVGRTEDVSFSPDNRRLALTAFDHDAIAIVDVDITMDGDRPRVEVIDVTEVSSPCLNAPHGVAFLDDETILVANRDAKVSVLRLPSAQSALEDRAEPTAIDPLPGCEFEHLSAPSALVVTRAANRTSEVLVCNNASDTVTRHALDHDPPSVTNSDVLLHRWLRLPDGIAVSPDNQWIAVSNHDAHTVMLYERVSSLHTNTDPDGILLGASFPHGVHFSSDGHRLFVSDGGKPYLHVFQVDGTSWRGVQYPVASLRIMDDEVFGLGSDRESGGPKGIDVDSHERVLAMTFENQPLTFLDFSAIVERSTGRCDSDALRVNYQLEILDDARAAEERIQRLVSSPSYRITEPLRAFRRWSRRRR